MDDVFHPGDLEAVHHEIDHCLIHIGKTTLGGDLGGAAFKGFHQGKAHFLGLFRDDHHALGAV